MSECQPCRDFETTITSWQPEAESECWDPDSTNLAHAPEWYTVFQKAYGHKPLYFMAKSNSGETAWLPAFLIRRPIVGPVITSMPFLDKGGPCGSSEHLTRGLLQKLVAEAKRMGARFVEIRSDLPLELGVQAERGKVNLVMPLGSDDEHFWKGLDAKVRNQVRKAMRSGLNVEIGGLEKLVDFYKIFCVNMRDLGSPVHSFEFFRETFAAFEERAKVALVYQQKTCIGGLIALKYNTTLAVPWASCLRKHFKLCPNMILYWETIRYACQTGFENFDFGRSSRDGGTYRFKRQWGAEEEPLYWYTIPINKGNVNQLSNSSPGGKMLSNVWSRLPLRLTRVVGPQIRKYLTQ